ncbi:unnamed protein product [Clonostachys rhizophaga]|uniref:Hydantoinase B/oxoprolinase domain-containing protein n=1 Tax=Clonostachys rhizophaga TaxID=160324 RepID=A0A9N9VU52_9HYPO|nr:unnamed protein product [Clonostachys rhizophaga]
MLFFTWRPAATPALRKSYFQAALVCGSVYWVAGFAAKYFPGSNGLDIEFGGPGFPQTYPFTTFLGLGIMGSLLELGTVNSTWSLFPNLLQVGKIFCKPQNYEAHPDISNLNSSSQLPIAGGTHLLDITVVTPVLYAAGKDIIFYTASWGHHRDIGGYQGISGNANARETFQEGASIISFKLVSNDNFDEEGMRRILIDDPAPYPGCLGISSIYDNLWDLRAQGAANAKGAALIQAMFEGHPREIQANAEIAVPKFFQDTSNKLGGLTLKDFDCLDNGSRIQLEIRINKDGSAAFDFTGIGPEVVGNNNVPKNICLSAIIYSLLCLINEEIPHNQGCLSSIEVINPEGSIINPSEHAVAYAGNTQTSQRIVDVILKAFEACAAGHGYMNSVGVYGGRNVKPGDGYKFAYGETIYGGSGADPN